jgi:hypothetical protein
MRATVLDGVKSAVEVKEGNLEVVDPGELTATRW